VSNLIFVAITAAATASTTTTPTITTKINKTFYVYCHAN
jgi:hypothetical protein